MSGWRRCTDASGPMFTSVANGYNFLQNFLLSPTGHGFHHDIIRSSRCESDQRGAVGGAGKTHLYEEGERVQAGRTSVCSALTVSVRACLYLEAHFLHVCDWITGHFVLCGVRERLPGDGCDRLRLLGQLGFIFGKTEGETGQRTVAHLQGSNQRYNQ